MFYVQWVASQIHQRLDSKIFKIKITIEYTKLISMDAGFCTDFVLINKFGRQKSNYIQKLLSMKIKIS